MLLALVAAVVLLQPAPVLEQRPKAPKGPVPTDVGVRQTPGAKQQDPTPPSNATFTAAPQPDPKELDRERRQREREIAIQEAIGTYTGWLTGVAVAQSVLLLGGLLATIRAANAAKKSAQLAEIALITAERAYIAPFNWKLTNLEQGKIPVLSFHIKNVGRTPGTMVKASGIAIYGAHLDPGEPSLEEIQGTATGHFLGSGAHVDVALKIGGPISEELWLALEAKQKFLWFFLELKYRERFEPKKIRTVRTCRRFNFEEKRFNTDAGAGYERAD